MSDEPTSTADIFAPEVWNAGLMAALAPPRALVARALGLTLEQYETWLARPDPSCSCACCEH